MSADTRLLSVLDRIKTLPVIKGPLIDAKAAKPSHSWRKRPRDVLNSSANASGNNECDAEKESVWRKKTQQENQGRDGRCFTARFTQRLFPERSKEIDCDAPHIPAEVAQIKTFVAAALPEGSQNLVSCELKTVVALQLMNSFQDDSKFEDIDECVCLLKQQILSCRLLRSALENHFAALYYDSGDFVPFMWLPVAWLLHQNQLIFFDDVIKHIAEERTGHSIVAYLAEALSFLSRQDKISRGYRVANQITEYLLFGSVNASNDTSFTFRSVIKSLCASSQALGSFDAVEIVVEQTLALSKVIDVEDLAKMEITAILASGPSDSVEGATKCRGSTCSSTIEKLAGIVLKLQVCIGDHRFWGFVSRVILSGSIQIHTATGLLRALCKCQESYLPRALEIFHDLVEKAFEESDSVALSVLLPNIWLLFESPRQVEMYVAWFRAHMLQKSVELSSINSSNIRSVACGCCEKTKENKKPSSGLLSRKDMGTIIDTLTCITPKECQSRLRIHLKEMKTMSVSFPELCQDYLQLVRTRLDDLEGMSKQSSGQQTLSSSVISLVEDQEPNLSEEVERLIQAFERKQQLPRYLREMIMFQRQRWNRLKQCLIQPPTASQQSQVDTSLSSRTEILKVLTREKLIKEDELNSFLLQCEAKKDSTQLASAAASNQVDPEQTACQLLASLQDPDIIPGSQQWTAAVSQLLEILPRAALLDSEDMAEIILNLFHKYFVFTTRKSRLQDASDRSVRAFLSILCSAEHEQLSKSFLSRISEVVSGHCSGECELDRHQLFTAAGLFACLCSERSSGSFSSRHTEIVSWCLQVATNIEKEPISSRAALCARAAWGLSLLRATRKLFSHVGALEDLPNSEALWSGWEIERPLEGADEIVFNETARDKGRNETGFLPRSMLIYTYWLSTSFHSFFNTDDDILKNLREEQMLEPWLSMRMSCPPTLKDFFSLELLCNRLSPDSVIDRKSQLKRIFVHFCGQDTERGVIIDYLCVLATLFIQSLANGHFTQRGASSVGSTSMSTTQELVLWLIQEVEVTTIAWDRIAEVSIKTLLSTAASRRQESKRGTTELQDRRSETGSDTLTLLARVVEVVLRHLLSSWRRKQERGESASDTSLMLPFTDFLIAMEYRGDNPTFIWQAGASIPAFALTLLFAPLLEAESVSVEAEISAIEKLMSRQEILTGLSFHWRQIYDLLPSHYQTLSLVKRMGTIIEACLSCFLMDLSQAERVINRLVKNLSDSWSYLLSSKVLWIFLSTCLRSLSLDGEADCPFCSARCPIESSYGPKDLLLLLSVCKEQASTCACLLSAYRQPDSKSNAQSLLISRLESLLSTEDRVRGTTETLSYHILFTLIRQAFVASPVMREAAEDYPAQHVAVPKNKYRKEKEDEFRFLLAIASVVVSHSPDSLVVFVVAKNSLELTTSCAVLFFQLLLKLPQTYPRGFWTGEEIEQGHGNTVTTIRQSPEMEEKLRRQELKNVCCSFWEMLLTAEERISKYPSIVSPHEHAVASLSSLYDFERLMARVRATIFCTEETAQKLSNLKRPKVSSEPEL